MVDLCVRRSELEMPCTSQPYMIEAVPAALVIWLVFAPKARSCHILPTQLRNLLVLDLMVTVDLLLPPPAAVPSILACLELESTIVRLLLTTLTASLWVEPTTVDLATETFSASSLWKTSTTRSTASASCLATFLAVPLKATVSRPRTT